MTDKHNLSFFSRLNLYVFSRESNGVPNYEAGLVGVRVSFGIVVEFNDVVESFDALALESMDISLLQLVAELERSYKGSILLDNGDAFLLNMIAPHMLDTFRNFFTTETMIFTKIASPNPCRLNFPFLVGKNELNLYSDLLDFYSAHLNSVLRSFKFSNRLSSSLVVKGVSAVKSDVQFIEFDV